VCGKVLVAGVLQEWPLQEEFGVVLCQGQTVPVCSTMDLSLISKIGGASVKTDLRKGKIHTDRQGGKKEQEIVVQAPRCEKKWGDEVLQQPEQWKRPQQNKRPHCSLRRSPCQSCGILLEGIEPC